jgi:tetratricopeptide (TPR) repeat protein
MPRLIFLVAVLVISALSISSAVADDAATCAKATGDESIAACTRQIESGKLNGHARAEAFNNRAAEYDDRATSDCDQAIRLDPKFAIAFNNRGFTYSNKGAYDRAISDYDQAIRLDPKFASAFVNRGSAYDSRGEYDRAISDLDQAIRLDPKIANAFNNRGFAYKNKGEYDRAISDYDQAIRLNPEYADAFANRGFAYWNKRDYANAFADYQAALRLDPNDASAREYLPKAQAALAAKQPPNNIAAVSERAWRWSSAIPPIGPMLCCGTHVATPRRLPRP